MERQKKSRGGNLGGAMDKRAGSSLSNPQYSTLSPALQALLDQARQRMNAADQRGDLSTAYKHFRIWQSLSYAAYGLPYTGGDDA